MIMMQMMCRDQSHHRTRKILLMMLYLEEPDIRNWNWKAADGEKIQRTRQSFRGPGILRDGSQFLSPQLPGSHC